MGPVLADLVPHIHDQHLTVVVHQLFADFVKFRKEFEALVVDQVREDEALSVTLLLGHRGVFPLAGFDHCVVGVRRAS